jgi:uncharacterized repeat protein (TIGR01451 family)
MKKILLTGSAMSIIASSLIFASPSLAAPVGTQVGETIKNTVDVSFKIGLIPQDEVSAEDEVAIDRKVNLTLVRTDNAGTEVNPGAPGQAITYQLTNETNDAMDFSLGAANVANLTASELDPSENDSFDIAGGFTYYIDSTTGGTAGVYDPGVDVQVTHIDALASGDTIVIHVVSNIQTGLVTDDRAAITLTATARQNDSASTLGATITPATANSVDPLAVDTIFADTNANGQVSRDGMAFDTDDYYVLAAGISATKSSAVVVGAFAGDTTGTNIPGATIEYCILVSNASGGAAASDVSITDDIPAEVTYVSAFGVKVGGADCATPGMGVGTESSGTITGPIGSLAAGQSKSVIFRALIK